MKKLLFLSIIAISSLSFMSLSLADWDEGGNTGNQIEASGNEKSVQNSNHDGEGEKDKKYYPEHRRHNEQTMDCTDQEQNEDNNSCNDKPIDHQEQNCPDGICTYNIPNF